MQIMSDGHVAAAPAGGLCCRAARPERVRTTRRSVTERHYIAASLWVSFVQLGVRPSNYFETSGRTVEAIPGSRSSDRSAARRRLSHRNHSRKVAAFIFREVLSRINPPGLLESLRLKLSLRSKVQKKENLKQRLRCKCPMKLLLRRWLLSEASTYHARTKSRTSHVTNAQMLWNQKAALCFQGSRLRRWLLCALFFLTAQNESK